MTGCFFSSSHLQLGHGHDMIMTQSNRTTRDFTSRTCFVDCSGAATVINFKITLLSTLRPISLMLGWCDFDYWAEN